MAKIIHPECGEGEEFIGNYSEELFQRVVWETKRMGNVAYDFNRKPVSNLFPVFVRSEEIVKKRANQKLAKVTTKAAAASG